jgi:hypothetical protein
LENEQKRNQVTKTDWESEIGGALLFTCRVKGFAEDKPLTSAGYPVFVSWFLCCSTAVSRIKT